MRHRLGPRTAVAAALLLGATAAPAAATVTIDPPAVAQVADRPLLDRGDRGPSVAAWQRQLNILTGRGLATDGVFGPNTEQATMDFQRFFDLRPDGVVGEHTRAVMRSVLAATRDFTEIARFPRFVAVGYTSESGYCFDIQDGDQFAVECGPSSSGPIDARVVTLDEQLDRLVVIGTAGPEVASVVVETTAGEQEQATMTNLLGTQRQAWTTPLPPDVIVAVRALGADGSEVRRIVFEDETTYLVLERGDRGQAVAAWQGKLNHVIGAGLALDGVFGSATEEATMAFQRFFGLEVDGIVGPETRDAMQYIYGLVPAP